MSFRNTKINSMRSNNPLNPRFRSSFQKQAFKFAGSGVVFIATIIIVAIGMIIAWDIYQYWNDIEPKQRAQAGITLIQTIATVVGGIAIFWNIILARRQLIASQEQNVTDRFFKAVEQLGHEQAPVRVG